jgi:sterol desaturase/sphingolipid hydroxylase (fatty acid hydroxylase superfamily)
MDPTFEIALRVGIAAAVFAAMAAWEVFAPKRALTVGRWRRWPSNLGIVVVDALLVRLLIPTAVVGVALYAAGQSIGLFHWLDLRFSVAVILGFLVLDLAIYLQHVMFHHVSWLWRLHRMHHADLDIDVTTGLRFHPIEILISVVIKIAVVLAFGIPPVAVIVFEVVLNLTSQFNHSNVAMPSWLDRIVRLVVVTPDMHRVHHSVLREEHNRNFGFNLPWWDRLFRTYRPQPREGHQGMTIGLSIFRDPRELRLDRLLTQPFRNDPAGSAGEAAAAVPQKVRSGPSDS